MQGALSDVRILDLTRVLSGPFAAMWLGDLGAAAYWRHLYHRCGTGQRGHGTGKTPGGDSHALPGIGIWL